MNRLLYFISSEYPILKTLILVLLAIGCNPAGDTREGFVELEDTRLYYQVMGSGEPLMVVHGGPLLDHGYMEPWLKGLASDYQLVFMDQRLSGRSSPESDSAHVTLDRFTEDAAQQTLSSRLDSSYLQARDSLRQTPAFRAGEPEAQLELLERSGHFSFMERPEHFMQLLRSFLSSH